MSKKFDLWLPAGSNGHSVSGDPMAHHIFMRCLFHAKFDETLKFDVKTVNINKKSAEFLKTGIRRIPAIQTCEAEIFETEDEILDFLEVFPPKRADDVEAEEVTSQIFAKFARFLKNVDKNVENLRQELEKLENFLKTNQNFLISQNLEHLDCLVLTRLHSIKIAAKFLKNLDIFGGNFGNCEKYLKNGYELEEFRQSCPADQEIIIHWSELHDAPKLAPKLRAELAREEPRFSF
ncbi:unnamed protein product [Caenorhabditis angaria]|uniref:GST N-terminal domain-containing protein n=1 Tax=Caenorhabditis angaria TaxID=860376 RepID=A0A9P1IG99_9PELO|nr:unnamed protein product [Caenorhabditis angaria]